MNVQLVAETLSSRSTYFSTAAVKSAGFSARVLTHFPSKRTPQNPLTKKVSDIDIEEVRSE
jgi:hypothetical protein